MKILKPDEAAAEANVSITIIVCSMKLATVIF